MPAAPPSPEVIVPVHAEEVTVERRKILLGGTRVHVETQIADHLVDETLLREAISIERVPVGRTVTTPPEARQEGDLMIIPVVEEIIIIEKRLVLREEIHVRRVRTPYRHEETVQVRKQVVTVEPIPAPPAGQDFPRQSTQETQEQQHES